MKSYLISDNNETLLGMRMAGISGEIVEGKELVLKKIHELIDNPDIGIIILTHKIKLLAAEEIMDIKLKTKETLIVEIPGAREKIESDFITRYIRESIGIKL